jgi:hypothetical protein
MNGSSSKFDDERQAVSTDDLDPGAYRKLGCRAGSPDLAADPNLSLRGGPRDNLAFGAE